MTRTLSRSLAEDLAQKVRDGIPLETAADQLQVGASTVWNWLAIAKADQPEWHPGQPVESETLDILRFFSEAITRARAEREAELVDRVMLLAETGGGDDPRQAGVSLKAATWVLERHPAYRERWGQRLEVHNTGEGNRAPVVNVLNISAAEARALYKQRTAAALPAPSPEPPAD